MKKAIAVLGTLVVAAGLLCACGAGGEETESTCQHEWISATYTEPKICSKCGKTEGDTLPIINVVKKSYQDTIDTAKISGQREDYAYNLLHTEMLIHEKELEQGYYDEEAVTKIVKNCTSQDEALLKLKDMLTYIVDKDEDSVSALMRKFTTLDSVTGTIEGTKIDITVADANKLLDELSMQPEAFGKVLAMLEVYDITNVFDTEMEKPLQFTERGFTYKLSYMKIDLKDND